MGDDELIRISEEGLLALNLEEMQTIQAHYRDENVRANREELGLPPNAPTDVELECLAPDMVRTLQAQNLRSSHTSCRYRNRRGHRNRLFVQDSHNETNTGDER